MAAGTRGGQSGKSGGTSGTRGGGAGGPVSGLQFPQPILIARRSRKKEEDWTVFDALKKGILKEQYEEMVDLREDDWYDIVEQYGTSSCVGWASTDSMLRWHLVKAGKISSNQKLSVRFTWMAAKETDNCTDFAETFIEQAGTPLKPAMNILKKFGCVLEEDFPFESTMVKDISTEEFYAKAANYRIGSYYSLILDEVPNLEHLRMWLSQHGPIMVLSDIDSNFYNLYEEGRISLEEYDFESVEVDSGHAFTLVGYDANGFIIRNSWGTEWGDNGYAYASNQYIVDAICEGYGLCL